MDARIRSVVAGVWVMLAGLALGGCGPLTFTVGVSASQQRLTETIVEQDEGTTGYRIAVIDVSGLIFNARRTGVLQEIDNPVAVLHEKLERARRDPRVRAVVLRINTPGGTVTASDIMYRQVMHFREQSGKPVVALMMDVAASGGYYLACGSDHIVAYPSTITGSVGVILQTVSFKPALDRLGIEATAFTSGPSKAAGSPLSRLTEEHRTVLQRLVDDFYQQFVHVVREARPGIDAEAFATVTDGRVFSGRDALAVGLVDELGDLRTAWSVAKDRAGIAHAHLVLYHAASRRVASPYAQAVDEDPRPGMTQINLAQINLHAELLQGGAGFYYLWVPTVTD